jgi:hypothetical protein
VKSGQINILTISKDPMIASRELNKYLGYRDEFGQSHTGMLLSSNVDIDVICLDTLDTLQMVLFDYLSATTLSANGKPDTLKAYGLLGQRLSKILWDFQGSEKLVLMAAHTMDHLDKKTGVERVTMKLSGSLKETVSSIPDIVAYITTEKSEVDDQDHYVAHLTQSPTLAAKNRYGFTEPIWDFTLPTLYKLIDDKIAATDETIKRVAASKVVTETPITAPAASVAA